MAAATTSPIRVGRILRVRPTRLCALVVAVLVIGTLPAFAGWSRLSSGTAGSASTAVPAAATPSVTISGRNVSLAWPQTSLSDGGPAATGYVVQRYNATNVMQPVGVGCAGTRTGLTCTESAVAPGAWKYTVTAKYDNWTGPESAAATATVGAPNLILSPDSVDSNSLPAALSGTIGNFLDSETVVFRLNSPTGSLMAGTINGAATPAAVPTGGGASVTVTVPAGTPVGVHSIYAVASPSAEAASEVVTITGPPPSPPVVTQSVIASHPNKGRGFTKPNGNYYVYANITGLVAATTTNVSSITSSANAYTMEVCPSQCDVDGVVYGYKSASPHLTTNGLLGAGAYAYSVTASNAGGSHTGNFSVTVDATAPRAQLLELLNQGSNLAGQPDPGDRIRTTFDESIAVSTLCSGWTNNASNQSTTVTVTITDGSSGGINDKITFAASASCGSFNFGTIDMGKNNYVGDGNITYSGSLVNWNAAARQIEVVLGTPCAYQKGICGLPAGNQSGAFAIYTPSALIQDLAGNSITGTGTTSTNDRQF